MIETRDSLVVYLHEILLATFHALTQQDKSLPFDAESVDKHTVITNAVYVLDSCGTNQTLYTEHMKASGVHASSMSELQLTKPNVNIRAFGVISRRFDPTLTGMHVHISHCSGLILVYTIRSLCK